MGADGPKTAREDPAFAALVRRSRDQLLDEARALNLVRVSKLRKEELARRILEAKRAAAPVPSAEPAEPPPAPAKLDAEDGAGAAAAARLDLGPAARIEEAPRDIPWSYGVDRVTAAAVDPDRLYVYWEVTDPAIERARAALGPGGAGAWLSLRVYDTTGILFDGTNAHSYFDHGLGRGDRQWYFDLRRPTSTAVVELGMKSAEGFFVRIARSGRVDFPRKEPAPWTEPEWMTVLAGGDVRYAGKGGPAPRHGSAHPAPRGGDGARGPESPPPVPLWLLRESMEGWEHMEWHAVSGEGWSELAGRTEWAEPAVVTSWEAGPFTYPVRIEPPRVEAWEGRTSTYQVGDATHVVYGPWQVVIRNLGARSGAAVVGRWQIYRWWLAEQGGEVRAGALGARRLGASEQLALGASERRWAAGSELRMQGASEVWRIGASEVRLRGASEVRLAGASEVRLAGASERRLAGASELRLGGASERQLGGASESRRGSEARLGGSEALARSEPADPGAYPALEGTE